MQITEKKLQKMNLWKEFFKIINDIACPYTLINSGRTSTTIIFHHLWLRV